MRTIDQPKTDNAWKLVYIQKGDKNKLSEKLASIRPRRERSYLWNSISFLEGVTSQVDWDITVNIRHLVLRKFLK